MTSKCVEMQRLNEEYSRLPKKTGEWHLSRRFVPGEGSLDASIMIIGQAPGAKEDEQQRPFVGRSGMLLDGIMEESGLNREDVYITSVVQFFPPRNRAPTRKEIELCLPFLRRQIEIVKPRCIVLLGNVASSALIGEGGVSKSHGKVVERGGIKYVITFHPAAALRFKRLIGAIRSDFAKLKECK